MKIGYLQYKPEFGKPEFNRKKIREMILNADADLLVLPELCTTGYTFIDKHELGELANIIPGGEDPQFFVKLASETGIAVVAGIAEKDDDKFYNSSVFVTPEGYVSKYRKIHLFNYEKKLFSAGDEGFRVYEYKEARIGLAICFDWFFPEALRVLMLKGAEIVCHPSNLVLPYCQDAMITRSLENRLFTITANRIGREIRGGNDFAFTGKSQITSPSGEVLKRAGEDSEEIGIVDIDPSQARDKTMTPNNSIFEDRKIAFYKEIFEQ